MADKLGLNQIECSCLIGVPAWERKRRQKIWLDLVLELDLSPAGISDRPEHTLDYAALEKEVRGWAEKRVYKLVEALAETVAEGVLKSYAAVESVRVRVVKKPRWMPRVDSVCVEIFRKR